MPTLRVVSITHLDASFENPAYKTVFMRGRTVSVSVTAQQLHTLVMLIGKYLSGYPILAVISKLCIISECKDRFESESRASGSFITPRMSPLGVGTQRVDDRFTGPTEPGPIAMAQGAKQLG